MGKDKHLEDVDHSIIRYANVWEDPSLLIEGLGIQKHHKVLSIASAGDNAFALAAQAPELVVAIDLNRAQLYLTELKKLAILHFEHKDYLSFIGFEEGEDRIEMYKSISGKLSGEAAAYWNGNSEVIEGGIVLGGKFEKYLKTFAKRILPLIHGRKKVDQLFKPKSKAEQRIFYDQEWNTWRWRWLFRIFFNKQVMGLFGRDRAFLKHVQVHVSTTILKKAGEHLASIYSQKNPILQYCLRGNFADDIPYYARTENYEKVKSNLDRLRIEYGYAQDAAARHGKFDRFNLSNIFEYMSPQVFEATSKNLFDCAREGGRFAYWNLMVPREMSTVLPHLERIPDQENWSERDKGFFYMQFVLEQSIR